MQQYSKSIIQTHILNKRRIRLRKIKYKNFEQEIVDQFNNKFQENKSQFFKLIKKTILINLNKREGGIYNFYLDQSNEIIVGEQLCKNCLNQLGELSNKIQYQPLKIPELPKLTKIKVNELPKILANDKATSYDCLTHQFVKSCNRTILSDIWKKQQPFKINKKLG